MFKIGSKVQLIGVADDDHPGIVIDSDHRCSAVRWCGFDDDIWRYENEKLRLVEPENDSEQVEQKKVSKEAILKFLERRSCDYKESPFLITHGLINDLFDEIIKEDEKLEDPDYKQYLKLKQRFEGN